MSLPRSNINNLDHAIDALLGGNSGLFIAKHISAVVAKIRLDPSTQSELRFLWSLG